MTITLTEPDVDGLTAAVDALRDWQHEGAPMQLHPGDVGWFCRFGVPTTAAAVRTWSRDGRVLAVGLLDGPTLLRVTTAPDVRRDEPLARRLVDDLTDPARGVLPSGRVSVEVPADILVHGLLFTEGWAPDEPWTPLRRDLGSPVEDPGVRVEVVGPEQAGAWSDVLRASFDGSTSTADRWHAMAAGTPFADSRTLLAYDDHGDAVATVTVWSAGPGRPGLLEPMGVHRDHRGHGYGRAITVAAAAALRDLGSSSALVCTPSANVGGVRTYVSAGFQPRDEIRDLSRHLARE